MPKITTIIRFLLTIALCVMVFRESGIWTGLAVAGLCISSEAQYFTLGLRRQEL